jgi:RNA polymerase-binding transcription factor DksA
METEPATADTVDVAVVEIDGAAVVATSTPLDLDGIQRDLADVEIALTRLDAGTYWTDEVTGNELPPELLAAQPTARRGAAATV